MRGAALAAVGLAALVATVIDRGRDPRFALATAALALLAGGAFLIVEQRAGTDAMLPLALLRRPAFAGANAIAAAMNFVGIGTILVTPLFLQSVQGRSALTGGLMLLPLFVPLVVLAPLAGRVTGRMGPTAPMTLGLCCGALGSTCLVLVRTDSSYTVLVPTLLGLGVGMGLLTAAVVAAALRAAPADRAGLASAANNTARQAAGAVGIAAYGAVTGSPAHAERFVHGLHVLGPFAALLWLAAAALAVTVFPRVPATG